MIGEEVKIGRRTVRHGIVRYLKDPQRMYNEGAPMTLLVAPLAQRTRFWWNSPGVR